MRKRSLFSVVVLLTASLMQAQQGFVKYMNAVGAEKFNIIEMPSGNYACALASGMGAALLNPTFSVMHATRLEADTFWHFGAIALQGDGLIGVGSYRKNLCTSTPRTYPVLMKMDTLGGIQGAWYYEFDNPACAHTGGDLIATTNGDIIAWGQFRLLFCFRVDQDGAVQWAKRFRQAPIGGFRFIKELPGGDLLAGINMDTAGAAVGRMDADGNFLWLKSYFRPRAMIADALIEDDGTMIITGFTDSLAAPGFLNPLPPTYWPKLFVMKLSGAGEVLWCKGYDISPYRWYTRPGARIERHHDGNYILLGNIGGLNHPFGYRPQLMKLDHNGDTLWTRSAGREGHVHDIINMTVCSDGGILYNGQSLSNSPDMFIFKTDSLGYLPCYNRWHATTIVDLFPVDSSFTLTSIDGATAHPAFITEAENPPITIIDGCAVGMEPPSMRPSGFRVYPNPTPGRFTLEVADPLLKDSYYSVYDALGKLLFQRPLPADATVQEVDLSRFGRGTYVVKLTDPQGVQWERVVLE